jgi:alanine racemase
VPEAAAGDEVVLIGRQGKESLSAEELARNWGTINYEVTCGITARVPRYYDQVIK